MVAFLMTAYENGEVIWKYRINTERRGYCELHKSKQNTLSEPC